MTPQATVRKWVQKYIGRSHTSVKVIKSAFYHAWDVFLLTEDPYKDNGGGIFIRLFANTQHEIDVLTSLENQTFSVRP
jgi:hypothetical protein